MERIIHHSPWRLAGVPSVAHRASDMHGSQKLVERVANAYKKAVLTPVGSSESIWLNEFATANVDTHTILMGNDLDAVSNLLKNPASSMLFYLFYGFDNLQIAKHSYDGAGGLVAEMESPIGLRLAAPVCSRDRHQARRESGS